MTYFDETEKFLIRLSHINQLELFEECTCLHTYTHIFSLSLKMLKVLLIFIFREHEVQIYICIIITFILQHVCNCLFLSSLVSSQYILYKISMTFVSPNNSPYIKHKTYFCRCVYLSNNTGIHPYSIYSLDMHTCIFS